MKEVFMVHIILPDVFTSGFYELIPQHKARINELLDKRILLNYSLDMQRKNIWAFIEAENIADVKKLLRTIKIGHEVKVHIHELAFHNAAPVALPDLIMN